MIWIPYSEYSENTSDLEGVYIYNLYLYILFLLSGDKFLFYESLSLFSALIYSSFA